MTLNDCPPGLFLFNGKHLGFKSEYTTTLENPRRYQVDAYVVESGEYFWGGAKTSEERGKMIVQPLVSHPTPVHEAPSLGADNVEDALIEARKRYPNDLGLLWFANASGMNAGTVTPEVVEWFTSLPTTDPAKPVEASKYADMTIDERANAMADDCVGDPWELLGYFREKLKISQVEANNAQAAAIDARLSGAPVSEEKVEADAARYRWLRDHSCPPHNFYISVPDEFAGVRYGSSEVDDYIDAALTALKTKPNTDK